MSLNLLGVNVLAGAKNDDIFLSSGDEEVTGRVETAEVAGVQPAIFKDFGSCVGAVVIALHDDATANRNLAGAVGGVGVGSRIGDGGGQDLHFNAGQRLAD